MIETCISITKKQVNVIFNQQNDGQFRKDGANTKLKELIPNVKFTTFEEGLKNTLQWYKNYEKTI